MGQRLRTEGPAVQLSPPRTGAEGYKIALAVVKDREIAAALVKFEKIVSRTIYTYLNLSKTLSLQGERFHHVTRTCSFGMSKLKTLIRFDS